MSVGVIGVIHLIGHIFMMQMDSFTFRVLIRYLELISVPNQSKDSTILIKFDTLSSWREIVSVRWSYWCYSLNWTYLYDADGFLHISGFDSVSRALFRSKSVQRFYYFDKIRPFVLVREIVSVHWS